MIKIVESIDDLKNFEHFLEEKGYIKLMNREVYMKYECGNEVSIISQKLYSLHFRLVDYAEIENYSLYKFTSEQSEYNIYVAYEYYSGNGEMTVAINEPTSIFISAGME